MTLKTPITLITGALGSGKTTLLQRIVAAADQRLAILINEFGEIAIDSRVVEGKHLNMIELTGGCVCCELTGEFEAAVRELLQTAMPARIVVEATGIAESDALVYEVEDSLPEVRLDGVICIVDADTSLRFPEFGYVGRTHLEAADLVIINKADLVTADEMTAVEREIRRFNDTPAIFHTVRCDFAPDLLFGETLAQPAGPSRRRSTPPESHRHGDEFQSFVYTTDRSLELACFKSLSEDLPQAVLRSKGFVRTGAGTYLFNYVAGRWELEEFPADRTRLVFIGRELEQSKQAIIERLSRCEVS